MDLTELTNIENELYGKVHQLCHRQQTIEAKRELYAVFTAYRQVHVHYAEVCEKDVEALKRGLFIQWYALTEPSFLTGIAELEDDAERKILQILNDKIENIDLDVELDWMLNHYVHWEWVFNRFNGFSGIDKAIANREDSVPDFIDRDRMGRRGQMGMYWKSFNI